MKNNLHFHLSSLLLLLGFIVLLTLTLYQPEPLEITAFTISEQKCEDGTNVGQCSVDYYGNACYNSKEGPRLEFDSKCYD